MLLVVVLLFLGVAGMEMGVVCGGVWCLFGRTRIDGVETLLVVVLLLEDHDGGSQTLLPAHTSNNMFDGSK